MQYRAYYALISKDLHNCVTISPFCPIHPFHVFPSVKSYERLSPPWIQQVKFSFQISFEPEACARFSLLVAIFLARGPLHGDDLKGGGRSGHQFFSQLIAGVKGFLIDKA